MGKSSVPDRANLISKSSTARALSGLTMDIRDNRSRASGASICEIYTEYRLAVWILSFGLFMIKQGRTVVTNLSVSGWPY